MSARTVSLQGISSLTTGDATESSHEPGVTVVIPCLNEQATIAEAIADAKAAFASWPGGAEVIVADNGSSDGSAELALAAGARVVPAVECGYGAALQAGFAASRAPYLVYADADLTYDFREGSKLLPALLDDDADRLPEVYPLPAVHGDGHRVARDEYLLRPSPEAGLGGPQ